MKENRVSSESLATKKCADGRKLDFIPFGFQYYRAPTPTKDKWERDLKKLSQDGYNTVKYWIQWRWNQPQSDRYDFSDIDELMDLAQKYSMKVILNIILDVAPVWLEEEYPDVAMISNCGEKIYGQATEYRQIGGVPGPCFHHADATKLRMNFVAECAKRYKDHPALLLWDVWNEPELSVGLRREPKMSDLLCYCPNSIKRFREWLENKYGTIERLNKVWGRNYRGFKDAEPPRRGGTTVDMIDWRLFFCDTITEDFKLRVETVKKVDGLHPVMCHTVPPPLFNSITCCSDDFKIAKIGDIVGNSVGSSALASGILRSAAKGKSIINSEIHAVYGNSLNGFHHPTMDDMLKHIFIPLVNGVRGFVFWQYNPERLGLEAPAWGNLDLKGNSTAWDLCLQNVHRFVRQEESALLDVCPEPCEVGIFIDAKNEIYSWNTSFGTEVYNDSLFGMFKMFHLSNYTVDFFSEDEVLSGEIGRFDTICFPAAFCLNQSVVQKIREFAEAGGTVLFEAYAGMIDMDTGMHCDDLPGCGLAEICGLSLDSIYSTTMIENGYDNILHELAETNLIPFNFGEDKLSGAKYILTYKATSRAQAVANFENGVPVIYESKIGKGKIVNMSTLLAYGCFRDGKSNPKKLLFSIVGECRNEWKRSLPYGLRADFIQGTDILVLQNETEQTMEFSLPFEADDVFDRLRKEGNRYKIAPRGIVVFQKKCKIRAKES